MVHDGTARRMNHRKMIQCVWPLTSGQSTDPSLTSDVVFLSLSFSFSKTIQVKIIDDEEYEKNKNFYLELAEPRMVDMSLQKGKTHSVYSMKNHIPLFIDSFISKFLLIHPVALYQVIRAFDHHHECICVILLSSCFMTFSSVTASILLFYEIYDVVHSHLGAVRFAF